MARFLFGRVWLIVNLLPHFHGRDRKLGRLRLPGRIPLILPPQEVLGRSLRLVDPRLASHAILEPPVSTPNSQINDEVKFLIKGSVQVGVINPWVGESGAVGVGQRELSFGPEILVERVVEDLQETGVNVGEEVFFTPLQAIGVFACGVSGMKGFLLLAGAPVSVILLVWTPVESTSDDVVSASRIAVVVTSGLANIDFARCGPRSECVVDGQHPDGGPEPVTLGHCGYDFDTTVFDSCAFEGVDAAGFDRRDNGAIGDVCGSVAVVVLGRSAVRESQVVVRSEESLVLQSRFDDELAILDHDIFFRAGSLFEFAISRSTCQQARKKILWPRECNIPKASEVHFLGPNIFIETLAPIFIKHKCVGVTDNSAEAIVDEVPGEGKAQSKSN